MTNLEGVDPSTLLIRYEELRAIVMSKPEEEVSDDVYREMVSICQILRRRSSGPPKPSRAATKIIPSADSF